MNRTVFAEKSCTQGSFCASFSFGWMAFIRPAMANMAARIAWTVHRNTFIGQGLFR
jgi:hypothetical protein